MKLVGAPPSSLEELETTIRKIATDVGAMIVPTVLRVEAPLVAFVEADAFAELIGFLRPRLIYMQSADFDVEEEVTAHFEGEAEEE